MNAKKIFITLALVIITIIGVSAVYAQQDPGGRQGGRGGRDGLLREIVNIVAEETGLAPRDIMAQLRQGSTLADIITENGGDVQAVIDAVVAEVTTRVQDAVTAGNLTQEEADVILANLEEAVTNAINGEFTPGQRPGRIGRALQGAQILIDAAAEATGLNAQEIRTQLRSGSTLADIIIANGGDVAAVIADAVATATEQINTAVTNGRITQEEADTMIASLETTFTNMVDGEFRAQVGHSIAVRGIIRLAAQETGLSEREIVEQYRAGNSLASILTANGVNVDEFIELAVSQAEARLAQAVENGRLTQEEADERLTQLREELTTHINEVPAPEAQSA